MRAKIVENDTNTYHFRQAQLAESKNQECLFPIHISVYLPGEKARYYPIKLPKKVSYEDCSGEHNHWVKPTHIFYFEINCKIAVTIHKLNELIKRHYKGTSL